MDVFCHFHNGKDCGNAMVAASCAAHYSIRASAHSSLGTACHTKHRPAEHPGAVLDEDVHMAVTPDEMRYLPEGMDKVINLGQRSCKSLLNEPTSSDKVT